MLNAVLQLATWAILPCCSSNTKKKKKFQESSKGKTMLYALGDIQLIQPTLSTPQLYKFNAATCVSHRQAFKLKMENFVRIAFWIVSLCVCLSAKCLPKTDIYDSNIELMQTEVQCVSYFKPNVFTLLSLSSFCHLLIQCNIFFCPYSCNQIQHSILHQMWR